MRAEGRWVNAHWVYPLEIKIVIIINNNNTPSGPTGRGLKNIHRYNLLRPYYPARASSQSWKTDEARPEAEQRFQRIQKKCKGPFPSAINLKCFKVKNCVILAYIISNLYYLSPPSI